MNQKSNHHYSIFALLRRSISSRDEAYLHGSAPGQHHSEQTRNNGEPFATLRPAQELIPHMSDEIGKTRRFAGRSERRFLGKKGDQKLQTHEKFFFLPLISEFCLGLDQMHRVSISVSTVFQISVSDLGLEFFQASVSTIKT